MSNHELTTYEILDLTYKKGKTISGSDREKIPVFDEAGNQIGIAPRLLCHRLGLIHKVVYLFIINQEGKLLLQVRGDGRLDVPVGGHVSSGDNSEKKALAREMFEELGFIADEDNIEFMFTYFREAEVNIKKPEESNRELRTIYSYKMNKNVEKLLLTEFCKREEQQAVLDIQWVSMDHVLSYCYQGMAADGLESSLPHYLAQTTLGSGTNVVNLQ